MSLESLTNTYVRSYEDRDDENGPSEIKCPWNQEGKTTILNQTIRALGFDPREGGISSGFDSEETGSVR